MAKLIQCNVPSTNIRKSRAFYGLLFPDMSFAQSLTDEIEAYHMPISVDGIQLTISPRQAAQEQIICYFAVDNLDAILTAVEQNGGTVVVEPFTLNISPEAFLAYKGMVKEFYPDAGHTDTDIGRSAIVQDPDGNFVGLTELREQVHDIFKYGAFSTGLDADQLACQKRTLELAKLLKPIKA